MGKILFFARAQERKLQEQDRKLGIEKDWDEFPTHPWSGIMDDDFILSPEYERGKERAVTAAVLAFRAARKDESS